MRSLNQALRLLLISFALLAPFRALAGSSYRNIHFTNDFVRTNVVVADIDASADKMAVLMNSKNFDSAVWIPLATNYTVNLGSGDGPREVWFGFANLAETDVVWTRVNITVDTIAPTLVITNPPSNITTLPMIQLQGYSLEKLSSLHFDVISANEPKLGQQGFQKDGGAFQCYDVDLAPGSNIIYLQAVDLAGNKTWTNFNLTLQRGTNLPTFGLVWPTNGMIVSSEKFTMNGWLFNPTAEITASTVDKDGFTNSYRGLVERTGRFWIGGLPLSAGTNDWTITATDAWSNIVTSNISVIKGDMRVTIDDFDPNLLHQRTITLTGTVSESSATVLINGVQAIVTGKTWKATNVPVDEGGTATFRMMAFPANSDPPRETP